MNIMAEFLGRKAYNIHLKGNALWKKSSSRKRNKSTRRRSLPTKRLRRRRDENPRHMMAYGVLLMRTRQYEKAKATMLKVEKKPGLGRTSKAASAQLCGVRMEDGQLDRAIELMKQASADGSNSMIYGSLGYMLIEKARETGDFAEAVEYNRKAYEYDEDDAVVLDNMGQLSLAMGKREEAFEFFKRAHERKPTQVDTLYYLSKLYAEDGETAAAIKMLERALSQTYRRFAPPPGSRRRRCWTRSKTGNLKRRTDPFLRCSYGRGIPGERPDTRGARGPAGLGWMVAYRGRAGEEGLGEHALLRRGG